MEKIIAFIVDDLRNAGKIELHHFPIPQTGFICFYVYDRIHARNECVIGWVDELTDTYELYEPMRKPGH